MLKKIYYCIQIVILSVLSSCSMISHSNSTISITYPDKKAFNVEVVELLMLNVPDLNHNQLNNKVHYDKLSESLVLKYNDIKAIKGNLSLYILEDPLKDLEVVTEIFIKKNKDEYSCSLFFSSPSGIDSLYTKKGMFNLKKSAEGYELNFKYEFFLDGEVIAIHFKNIKNSSFILQGNLKLGSDSFIILN